MNGCRVLYYHTIADELPEIYPSGISLKRFEGQMLWLKKLGYRFTTLSKALGEIEASDEKRVCLSLDDGFACNYKAIIEIAVKLNIRPCLFLIGKCLDNHALAWNHRLIILKHRIPPAKLNGLIGELLPGAELSNFFAHTPMNLKDQISSELWTSLMPMPEAEYLEETKPFFSQDQLAELLDSGAEIASHSYSHPDFSRLSLPEAKDEIRASFAAFADRGLAHQKILAYPYGLPCNTQTEAALISQLGLQATMGTLFTQGDNALPKTRWQRQCMEASPLANLLEFGIRPLVRRIRKHF